MSKQVKFAFDFFGFGNIGDDLMLEGFLRFWPKDLACYGQVAPAQSRILNRRFSGIEWRDLQSTYEHKVWLGVGDTPIQVLSGPAMLQFLEKELLDPRPQQRLRLLLGIGVEAEAVAEAPRFKRILSKVDYIWSRDHFSGEVLIDKFDVNENKVVVSSDLANSALKAIFGCPPQATRPVGLALNLYCETRRWSSLCTLVSFLREQASKHKVIWLANEVRDFRNSEVHTFRQIASLLNMRRKGETVDLVIPSNFATSVSMMVDHFSACQTVISSRYHCILTAAWAGCQVAGIGRSSKIVALCKQLSIPCIAGELSRHNLEAAAESSCIVPREALDALAQSASLSIVGAARLARQAIVN